MTLSDVHPLYCYFKPLFYSSSGCIYFNVDECSLLLNLRVVFYPEDEHCNFAVAGDV